ncbi:GNAT domain-containing protein [Melampsora americana]|nr:GNAT domain-containing protein [Melampsora americana]
MKLNQHIALVGPRVVLVPYRSEHVEVYNEWMKDSELKELTASESLSLEEEYEMCKSWSNDSDKRDLSFSDKENEIFHDSFRSAHLGNHRMIGDVNLFLSTVSPSFEDQKKEEDLERTRAEFEIMIASKVHRRKGYGLEVMKIFISYAHLTIPTQIDFDFVKISLTNQSSIHLFKKLGFQEFKINDYFQEIELRFDLFSPLNLQLSNDPLHRYCIPWPTKDITSDHQEINLVQFWILPWP